MKALLRAGYAAAGELLRRWRNSDYLATLLPPQYMLLYDAAITPG